MTRWLMFGCLGLLLVVGVLSVGAYFFLIRPAQSLLHEFTQVFQLDAEVKNKAPYTPPASGRPSPDQVQRFVRVAREVHQGLGARFTALEGRLERLGQQVAGRAQLDYRAALDLFRDSGTLITEAKRLQVQALNRQGFSPQEYAWVRSQVYSALGYGVPELNPQEILRQIGSGEFNTKVALNRSPSSQATTRLVEPYRQELERYYPFTWFGL
jgi:hypothetical protein